PLAFFRPFFLLHACDIDDLIARIQVHQLDTLRVAAADANPFHRAADDDATLGDHHQFVFRHHILQGDELSGLLGLLHRDDPLAAALLHTIVAEHAALADAALAHHQELGALLHHHHADHAVALVELDPLHAGGGAAHFAGIGFVEADAHAKGGGEDDVV